MSDLTRRDFLIGGTTFPVVNALLGTVVAATGKSRNSEFSNTTKGEEKTMASEPMRDPIKDHLLTPKNSALIIIDYQPLQVGSVASMDRRTLVQNIVTVVRLAKLFQLPMVLSTVNVKTG